MVIRLDDERFPANAAYFRTAAAKGALGTTMLQCFKLPFDSSAAPRPFITLYRPRQPTCATSPLAMPVTDIVYGEFIAPTDGEMYPPGTVLISPRSVAPNSYMDTPWIITFQACSAYLLGGLVPVGRVITCIEDSKPASSNTSTQLFDSFVMQCFRAICKSGECDIEDDPLTIGFSEFTSK